MTATREEAPVLVEVWKPPKRLYVTIALVIVAVILVVSAPVVAVAVHQVRLNSQASTLTRLTALESANAAQIKRINQLEADRKIDAAASAYATCVASLSTWTFEDAVLLYFERSPGPERTFLLSILPAQPHCVKP